MTAGHDKCNTTTIRACQGFDGVLEVWSRRSGGLTTNLNINANTFNGRVAVAA